MIKKFVLVVSVLVVGSAGVVMATAPEKVVICHHDQGNSGKDNVTIEVNENAVQAHINHGDTLGACPIVPPEEEPPKEEKPPVEPEKQPESEDTESTPVGNPKVKSNPIVPLNEQTGK
jgi:hypothetical protein